MARKKPLRDLLVTTKPVIFVDCDGQTLSLNVRRDEIYILNRVYSFQMRSRGVCIWSTGEIDPHPEVWHDERWLHSKDYELKNRGHQLTEVNTPVVFGGAVNIYVRTNGTSDVQLQISGRPYI